MNSKQLDNDYTELTAMLLKLEDIGARHERLAIRPECEKTDCIVHAKLTTAARSAFKSIEIAVKMLGCLPRGSITNQPDVPFFQSPPPSEYLLQYLRSIGVIVPEFPTKVSPATDTGVDPRVSQLIQKLTGMQLESNTASIKSSYNPERSARHAGKVHAFNVAIREIREALCVSDSPLAPTPPQKGLAVVERGPTDAWGRPAGAWVVRGGVPKWDRTADPFSARHNAALSLATMMQDDRRAVHEAVERRDFHEAQRYTGRAEGLGIAIYELTGERPEKSIVVHPGPQYTEVSRLVFENGVRVIKKLEAEMKSLRSPIRESGLLIQVGIERAILVIKSEFGIHDVEPEDKEKPARRAPISNADITDMIDDSFADDRSGSPVTTGTPVSTATPDGHLVA